MSATALLLLPACGRIGFDLLSRSGEEPEAGSGAGASADAGRDGGGGGREGMSGRDPGTGGRAGMDAAIPPAPDDGGTAGATAGADAAPRADAGPEDDAAVDDDADVPLPDAGGDCTTTPVTDYCAQVPALPIAPAIDGELDCGLALQAVSPMGWTNGTNPLPAGNGVRLAAAWRPDGLYFYLEVTDPTRLPRPVGMPVWCGDGVELYVDDDGSFAASPMYDAPGSIQTLAVAPADDTNPVSSGGERWRTPNGGMNFSWTSPRYAAYPRPFGYVFEAFIAADDLDLPSWSLAAGGAVGLNLSINVSVSADPPPGGEVPECGRRLGQYFLRIAEAPCAGGSCFPFANAAAFCTPSLL